MDRKEADILKEMHKLGEGHVEEIERALEIVARNMIEGGLLPKEALNIPQTKIEALYAQGYQLFNTGKYKQASKIFGLLITVSPEDARFFMAFGASLHKLGKYEEAVKNYAMAASRDINSPLPLYHAVDCAMEIGDKLSAVCFLEMVIDRCQDKEEYSLIKERCKIMQAALVKFLNEGGAVPKKAEA